MIVELKLSFRINQVENQRQPKAKNKMQNCLKNEKNHLKLNKLMTFSKKKQQPWQVARNK
jgi:hypothetical protein